MSKSKYSVEDWISWTENVQYSTSSLIAHRISQEEKPNKQTNNIKTTTKPKRKQNTKQKKTQQTNKPHKQTHHHPQNNQPRGQRLQRSHSHCSEKTCHLHHSTHAISSGLAVFCLWGLAPDVLYLQMPRVPHSGDQNQSYFPWVVITVAGWRRAGCVKVVIPKIKES